MPNKAHYSTTRPRHDSGFTLVEILVAAGIIILSVLGVVTMTRKSREMDITFRHRMRARAIIDSCFESTSYHYSNYASMTPVDRSVLIEKRNSDQGEVSLTGSLSITVSNPHTIGAGSAAVEYKEVTITVGWDEPEGKRAITVSKYITEL